MYTQSLNNKDMAYTKQANMHNQQKVSSPYNKGNLDPQDADQSSMYNNVKKVRYPTYHIYSL